MIVVGILGGVASGKSLVASQLEQLGAAVVDADRIGHEVLEEAAVREALWERWGDSVVGPQGKLDRAAIAQRVFAPPPQGPVELTALEQIVHPRIKQRLHERLGELERQGQRVVALDAALLLKAGWHIFCNKLVLVDTPRSLRLERARQRGWTDADMEAREAAQEPVEEKRQHADWVIDNSGSPEHTFSQVKAFWRSLEELSHCTSPN